MTDFLWVMAAPLAACFLLVLIHSALGVHVLGRGVIFVDLAMAQIAVLGQSLAILQGAEPGDLSAYLWSFGFTLGGAALFSFLWDRSHSVLQEAFIGITFSMATAGTLLLLANAPHGAEHIQGTLSGGGLLWVGWREVGVMALLYGFVGLFLFMAKRNLEICTFRPQEAKKMGVHLKLWDFLFYAAFGIVVTESVRVAGVLAVFSFLIVPVVCATLLGLKGRAHLLGAWGIGTGVALTGTVLSYWKDLPTGAVIVCLFGGTAAMLSIYIKTSRGGHR